LDIRVARSCTESREAVAEGYLWRIFMGSDTGNLAALSANLPSIPRHRIVVLKNQSLGDSPL